MADCPTVSEARLIGARYRARPLGNNLPRVEFDEHGGVGFEIFDRDGQAEVVEEEELEF